MLEIILSLFLVMLTVRLSPSLWSMLKYLNNF